MKSVKEKNKAIKFRSVFKLTLNESYTVVRSVGSNPNDSTVVTLS